MTRHRVKCVTCGRADYADGGTPPSGWGLECDRCQKGSPVRPKKTVRQCSYCRDDIVVMGVPGGVRLVCSKCAAKDANFVQTEKLTKEMHQWMTKASDLEEQLATARANLQKSETMREEQLRLATDAVMGENLNLKQELQKKAEQTLADRVKVKMQAKPWQTKRETIREFLEWFIVWHSDIDIEEAMDRYFHADG